MVAILVVSLRFADPEPLPTFRDAFFDFAQRLLPAGAEEPAENLVIVDIDERSLAALGQWPWPRDLLADLVGRIAAGKPSVLGINIIFSESDRLSPENLLKRFPLDAPLRESLAALPSNDSMLAAKLRTLPVVLAAATAGNEVPVAEGGAVQTPVLLRLGRQTGSELRRYPALLRNLQVLEDASAGVGVASLALSGDGVIRKLPVVMLVGDAILPSFAVEVLRIAKGAEAISVEIDGPGVTRVTLAETTIETAFPGHVWLRDRSAESFSRISAAALLADEVPLSRLQGRIVLLGSTGVGLGKSFITPGGELRAALDVQALFVENLVNESYLIRPHYAAVWEGIAAALCFALVIAFTSRLSGYVSLAAAFTGLVFLFAVSLYVFDRHATLLDPSYAALVLVLSYLVMLSLGIVEAQRLRRRSDEEREMALVLAEAANRSKTSFLANMSHELRTPLNAILGFSEMMKREILGPVSPPKYRDYVSDIHHMGQHLLSLVNDILEMSKVEAGESQITESEFPVREILEECMRTVKTAYQHRATRIVQESTPFSPLLWGDRRMFTQMVLNLLSNAVKYTPSGGQVKLTGKVGDDGAYRLSISDTGIGMSDKEVTEAFEPFRRVDHALASNLEGIGLGLPLTKAMIEMHGGKLEVASVKNHGTTATLVFPAERVRSPIERVSEEEKRYEESA
ncbi:CHASE2 domain-containing protein [Pelagibius litoralis]|uniref:histidine kinase n=1 Tax=Pelagibius litoralis TaxID=374515 RepID=A0A967F0U1_9PROT|nr:CHASE2 domain-containing protein [Pelagibius litoralis]NIA70939.1 CHASE2 domain-containing protein [Pelagibius litoralis]